MAAEADDRGNVRNCQRSLDRALDVADAPSAARDEHDLALWWEREFGACALGRPTDEKLRGGQSVHAVDPRVRARNGAYLFGRLGMGDQVEVGSRRRPIVHCSEVGDRRADGHANASRPSQTGEHLHGVWIGRDDDVGVHFADKPQETRTADAG